MKIQFTASPGPSADRVLEATGDGTSRDAAPETDRETATAPDPEFLAWLEELL